MNAKIGNPLFGGDNERASMLAAIIDSSEDAIVSKTLNGIITSWNKAAERLFGYSEDEALGEHISILIPTDKLPEEDFIINSLRQGKRIQHFQTIRVTKSGKEIPISLSVSPVLNAKGEVIGASKIARDISAQKEAEAQLRRHTRHLEIINQTSRKLAGLVDADLILKTVIDATTELTGASYGAFFHSKTDSRGESFILYALSGTSPETFEKIGMPRIAEMFNATFSGKSIVRSDDIREDPRYGNNKPYSGIPDGHLPVVSYLAVPVISQTGMVIGGLFFGHTERGKFREEHESLVAAIASFGAVVLEKAKLYEAVKSLNAKKDEFIGFASHELKTPITTVSGYLQLAQQYPSMAAELTPKISRQITRLSGIISDLLDISKINSSGLELNFTRTSLAALVRESVETIKTTASNHRIYYDVPVDDVTLQIDGQKIGQVIVNLLNNAVKYSADGTEIYLNAIRIGDLVQVQIADQGIGIDSSELEKIFNRFYRVSHLPDRPQGMGLGLYLCKEIIDMHHGKIWAESTPGKGSTFFFSIPVDASTK